MTASPRSTSATPFATLQRRERARVAQRRSRAARKASLETLHRRTQALADALEQLSMACADFSGIVLQAVRDEDVRSLRDAVEPWLKHILGVVAGCWTGSGNTAEKDDEEVGLRADNAPENAMKDVSEEGDEEAKQDEPHLAEAEDDEEATFDRDDRVLIIAKEAYVQRSVTTPAPEQVQETTSRSKVTVPSEKIPMTGLASPRLTYGLLPSLCGQDVTSMGATPLDISPYLDTYQTRSMTSLAISLYWNTMAFAHHALTSQTPSALATARKLFFYTLHFDQMERIRARIKRRMKYKPANVPLTWGEGLSKTASWSNDTEGDVKGGPDVDLIGLRQEAELAVEASLLHSKITKKMRQNDDAEDGYIDAFLVEERFRSHWGIDFTSPQVPLWCRDMTFMRLAEASQCLGNGIGFAIRVVDEAAVQVLSDMASL